MKSYYYYPPTQCREDLATVPVAALNPVADSVKYYIWLALELFKEFTH